MDSQRKVSIPHLFQKLVASGAAMLTLGLAACAGPVYHRPWAPGTVVDNNDGTPPILVQQKGARDFRGGAAHGVAPNPDLAGAMVEGYAGARDSFYSGSYRRYASTLCKSGEFLGADGYVHDILTPCVRVRYYNPYFDSPIRVYGYGGGHASKKFKFKWHHSDNPWTAGASGRILHSDDSNDAGWPVDRDENRKYHPRYNSPHH